MAQLLACLGVLALAQASSLYDLSAISIAGESTPLYNFKGLVSLVVNVATF